MEDYQRELRAKLEQLDVELKRTRSVDEAGRDILHKLQQDVQDLLARSGEAVPLPNRSLTARLLEGIRHFEATHPALATLMEQVVNTLSGMGI